VSSLAPKAPQIWGRFGEKWAVRGGGAEGPDTGLGAVFGPAMFVWTKRDRCGGFGASVGDALRTSVGTVKVAL
jgi:hypothetical protein